MTKNWTLIENLIYANKLPCKKELTVSSKAESVESIFSSLVPQDNLFFFSIGRRLALFLISGICCTLEDVERS